MAEGRSLIPRIRAPKITIFGRASRTAAEKTTAMTTATKPGNGTAPTKEAQAAGTTPPEAKPAEAKPGEAKPGEAKPGETKPATSAMTPAPNLQERMEGLQGWMAEIERKQARLTYFGGLALLLALAAAGVALYFGLTTHSDSASKSQVDSLTSRVGSLEGAVAKNSKDTQNALNASIAQLQQSISGLQKQQAQSQATISTLQTQIAAAKAATPPAVTPTTPGGATTTTTTTPNGGNNP